MSAAPATAPLLGKAMRVPDALLALLRCPVTGDPLQRDGDSLVGIDGGHSYRVDDDGIPRFAEQFCSDQARAQEAHYEKIAGAYVTNLGYPHTREYMAYLDRALLDVVRIEDLGTVAEICCGHGEALGLLRGRIGQGVGVDISSSMLAEGARCNPDPNLFFVQGDATMLPLADDSFDSVFMLGGIHHVSDRRKLFSEIARILKPNGRFYFREPVSDFLPWRAIRSVVYRLSPTLDHTTERPLLHRETVPVLEESGLACGHWKTYGFLGFCLFMNSDVLVFNRLFRFMPGITGITRAFVALDDMTTRLPALRRAGLQVVGVAEKGARTR